METAAEDYQNLRSKEFVMKKLTIFKNERFGEVRTFSDEKGDPWFSAPDVCRALELDNVTEALRGLDEDEKRVSITETLGGSQKINYITEPGMYRLIIRSRKPKAKEFTRWVTHEVLPQLRKTGTYSTGESGKEPIKGEVRQRISMLKYLSTLPGYSPEMRVKFAAEAMSLLTGEPIEAYLPPSPEEMLREERIQRRKYIYGSRHQEKDWTRQEIEKIGLNHAKQTGKTEQ
jgi:prophage antirepressor-like protein